MDQIYQNFTQLKSICKIINSLLEFDFVAVLLIEKDYTAGFNPDFLDSSSFLDAEREKIE